MSLTHYDRTVLADRPVLYLPLDDGAGATASALAGSDGTYNGSPTLEVDGPDAVGSTAVDFTGSSQYVSAANIAAFTADPMTMEAWVYLDASSAVQVAVGYAQTGTGNAGWALLEASGSLIWRMYNTSSTVHLDATTTATIGAWLHAVGVYESDVARLYINGEQVGEDSTPSGTRATPVNALTIGRLFSNGTDYPLNGKVAAVAVYDYVLTVAQAAQHYAAAPVLPRTVAPHARRFR